jgi:acetyl-CoA/propionyl-CoA carboxylase biotin carboxyl carrier protein
LKIASGEPLGFGQDDLEPRGHAIECRVNAEDPGASFMPTPGRIVSYREPSGPGIRVDSGYVAGDEIPGAYDSLVAKLIVWGPDREAARRRTLGALSEFEITGVKTTIPAHLLMLEAEEFRTGTHTTRTVEEGDLFDSLSTAASDGDEAGDFLMVEGRPVRLWNPAMAPSAAAAVHGGPPASGDLVAPMQGTILDVLVSEGQEVGEGEGIVVLEAMKMETTIAAPAAGTVEQLLVAKGDTAAAGQLLAVVK